MRDNRPESGADRIRRRLQQIEENRRAQAPRISPFTLISLLIILVFTFLIGNMVGN